MDAIWKIKSKSTFPGSFSLANAEIITVGNYWTLRGLRTGQPCRIAVFTCIPWSPGRGRSWITGLAGISGSGPNSEPRGNNWSFPETRERDRVPVKKIGSRDSIFSLVNSTYSFEITNYNQHASNIKYLANLIKKYWTYFRYQKLADFLVCFPPSVRVQVRWSPSWKICLRIQLSFGFGGRAVKAFDNFSRKLAWLLKKIF